MAFTQITSAGFGLTTGTLVGVAASFSSTVSVGGTLTYEDVTNVDSVGLITARNGIEVTDKGVQVGTGATVDSAGDNILTFLTNGSERIRVTSGGTLLVAKTTTSLTTQGSRVDNGLFTASGDSSSTNLATNSGGNLSLANVDSTDNNFSNIGAYNSNGLVVSQIDFINTSHSSRTGDIAFLTHNGSAMSERLRITSAGRIGINDSSPSVTLDITGESSGNGEINVKRTSGATCQVQAQASIAVFGSSSNHRVDLKSNSTTAVTIDTSQRLLIGTTGSRSVSSLSGSLQVEGTSGDSSTISVTRNVASAAPPRVCLAKSRGTSVGSNIAVQSGDSLGEISFSGADGTDANSVAATILCQVDGTPGSNDMPGRLIFATTADGASSPTERLRIHAAGHGEFSSGAVTRVVVADDVSLSGGSTTVTGIPSWATKITVILYRASLTGGQDFLVILRADGNDITSNYNSASSNDAGSVNDTSTAGFIITNTNSSHKTSGRMVIERVGTDTKWVSSHTVIQDGGTPRHGAGDLSSYSGTIDGLKIKDTGSNTFDNGTITVIAEA